MSKSTGLTSNQRLILEHAIEKAAGHIEWFPDGIKGNARAKVLESLHRRSLVDQRGQHWGVTDAAYVALSREAPGAVDTSSVRENSKQATVLAMLKRPEGATNGQIQLACEWQPHTVRGFLSGVVKKKLKLTLITEQNDAKETVYRLA